MLTDNKVHYMIITRKDQTYDYPSTTTKIESKRLPMRELKIAHLVRGNKRDMQG